MTSGAAGGLAALPEFTFERLEPTAILGAAATAVATLGPCQTEATYRLIDDAWRQWPPTQELRRDIDRLVAEAERDGAVQVHNRGWGWAFVLAYQGTIMGSLIVSATNQRPATRFCC
jgi:hypothetical protein